MLRIHFSADDLLRTRIAVPRSPVAEILFAADLLWQRRGAAAFDPWRYAVRSRLGPRARHLTELVRAVRPTSELFTEPQPDLGRAGCVRPVQDVRKTTAAVHEFGRTAVQPYWQRLSVLLEIERSARGQAVLNDGIEGLLRSLHATATWEPPFLQIAGRPARKIFLDSAGLVITPSVFLFDRPTLLFSNTDPHSTPVLVYPAPLDVNTKQLWARSTSGGKTLGALLGRTRAEALHALLDSYTTGGLGQRLGISAAAASQHTSVLRNAGLITTRRQKNAVSHSLTPLGLALLNGDGFAEKQT